MRGEPARLGAASSCPGLHISFSGAIDVRPTTAGDFTADGGGRSTKPGGDLWDGTTCRHASRNLISLRQPQRLTHMPPDDRNESPV